MNNKNDGDYIYGGLLGTIFLLTLFSSFPPSKGGDYFLLCFPPQKKNGVGARS